MCVLKYLVLKKKKHLAKTIIYKLNPKDIQPEFQDKLKKTLIYKLNPKYIQLGFQNKLNKQLWI